MKLKLIKAIRWTEKYTKTDMIYAFKNSFWLLLGQALNFFLALGLLWAFANYLSKEIYGEYRFLITSVNLLGLSTLSGINTSIIKSVSRNFRGTIYLALYTKIRWGLLGSLSSVLISIYYYMNGNSSLGLSFLMISFFVPILETFAIYTGYLQGLKNFKLQAFLYSLQRIIVVLITIIAILFSGNLFIVMLTYLITTSLMQWLGYFITLTKYPPNLNIDSEAISFGKYLSLIGLARIGAQGLDKIALWYFAGSVQVAMYVISIALPGEIVSAFGQINNVAFPKMAEKEHFNLRLSLLKKYFTFFLLLIPIVIIYILAVPLVFKLMFPQYLDSVFFTQIASLLILFVPNGLLNHYLIITNHKRGLYTINFSEPLITLLLYALLIPFLGVIGAIFTLILKNVINTIILLYFFITHKIENF